jgi:putative oxidoreductase
MTVVYAGILTTGIAMIHAREGWFVVGGGRYGVEYSVLLIVALACTGLQHPARGKNAP